MTSSSRPPTFYGWWIVLACMTFATVCWSLGTFGMSVYVFALSETDGGAARFPVATVSTAVTLAYLVSAALMVGVGSVSARHGTRPVVAFGAGVLALAMCALPQCRVAWQLYGAFALLGVAMSCLSTVAIGTTLAPWFDVYQGRAVSTAMLGASIGGMVGTPLLMAGIRHLGFAHTAWLAAGLALLVIVPLAVFVMRRQPQDLGLHPDGLPPRAGGAGAANAPVWTRGSALRTRQFQTQVFAFGVALMVQVGFLSHHVPIALPWLGSAGAAAAVTAAAVAAFIGRLLLARYADQVDVRKTAAGVLAFGCVSLVGMALFPSPVALMVFSISYGLTVGNITTLPPIITRREFGSASFGVVFGTASMLTAVLMALGPSLFGAIRQAFGGYAPALLLGAALDVLAVAALIWGGRRPLVPPAAAAPQPS
ncbi:hypothetical protein CCO03_03205 [Comamonas serinivorans]|uniref:Major facilitator superfamily (MFS) profile domain-containing protein n=1 Tax=Comamonas serinivorans TaxID=1082851 RepID=A0A1Y0EK63_9BURK|nr:MFS transporter [Comamonas serinivorans]ARU03821.1 hypothetical protein CCO03_03205 [Comamonas serinivorans]